MLTSSPFVGMSPDHPWVVGAAPSGFRISLDHRCLTEHGQGLSESLEASVVQVNVAAPDVS